VIVVASSVVIATAASLFAAWRAARLKPSEALRSE
jgi:ABC-type lipoprotein release transport system permease subunit